MYSSGQQPYKFIVTKESVWIEKNSSTSTGLVWDTKIDEDKAEDRQGRPENNGWTIGNIQPDCRLDWSFCTGHFWITTFYFPNSFCLMRFAL